MTHRFVQVGTGGRGEHWCRSILQPAIEAGHLDPVAAVDVDPDTHVNARDGLGLSDERCYEDAATAFEVHDADFCTVVVPPWVHEEIVDVAVEHGLHVLSEKPIADTLAASVRIRDSVEAAGLKMGVTMSHRFDRDKTSLRRRIRAAEQGPLDYLVGRFTCDMRSYGDWADPFRHEMDDPLLIEGAVHQLDFLADMAGKHVETLYADTWRPEWAEYDGDCQGLVQLRMENGTRVAWEGAMANAVGLNCWGSDYVRAECRDATLILDDRELERRPRAGDDPASTMRLDEQELWSDQWLVAQFVDWLDGGEPMATNVDANLQSVAIVEAAIESSETGEPVNVQELLAETESEQA